VRARIDAKSTALGVATEWSVDSSHLESLRPAELLQMIRSLQEMVSNAQRHARTPSLSIRIGRTDQGKTQLSVRDFGIGVAPGTTRKGRGLKSLKTRARRLGGSFQIEPKMPGSEAILEF
jgi:signal transduction histidine kinase